MSRMHHRMHYYLSKTEEEQIKPNKLVSAENDLFMQGLYTQDEEKINTQCQIM